MYYRATDCFTCFGVLGDWVVVARQTRIRVWLALDEAPTASAAKAIQKMRLPFRIGTVSLTDRHGTRGPAQVKEILFVSGSGVDSATVRLGGTNSPLASRLLNE